MKDARRGTPGHPPCNAFSLGYHCKLVVWVASLGLFGFFFLMLTALIKNILQGSAFFFCFSIKKSKATSQGVASPTHSTTFSSKRPYQVEHN